ncbi:MAG: FAD-dependent monooxygenase [Pseudomonadota bacterium]
MKASTDILVAGGGIAGLSASCAFGASGFNVVCVDPVLPPTNRDAVGADLRTTAFLRPAQRLLCEAGVWQRLRPHATPLKTMRIVDAGGTGPRERLRKDFEADDIDESLFGYNLPNTQIRASLLERLEELETVKFHAGLSVDALTVEPNAVNVRLSDGSEVESRFIVAADGRDSYVRQTLNIGVRRYDFRQSALTFAVSHDKPHRNVSIEVHRSGGPFTLVPLPDHAGRPSSAVVWMESHETARRLAALDQATFERAATKRSANVLGPLTLLTRRTSWPIVSQLANRFYGPRTALVAEAAHVMPPIGAQGLNTSLKDLQRLLALARQTPDRIGEADMLKRYNRSRFPEVAARMAGVSVLNQASMTSLRPLRDARALGLQLIHTVGPVRKTLMRLGLGR